MLLGCLRNSRCTLGLLIVTDGRRILSHHDVVASISLAILSRICLVTSI